MREAGWEGSALPAYLPLFLPRFLSFSNTLFLSLTKGRCSIFPFLYSRSIDQTVIIAFTIFSMIYRSLSRRNVIGSYIWNHRQLGVDRFFGRFFSILFVRRSTGFSYVIWLEVKGGDININCFLPFWSILLTMR